MEIFTSYILVAIVVVMVSILVMFRRPIFNPTMNKTSVQIKTCIVLGSGGHTAEMIKIAQSLNKMVYSPRIYIVSQKDELSREKLDSIESTEDVLVHSIPRSREVAQSYFTSIATTAFSFLHCFPIVFAEKPKLLLLNGPGTCVPLAISVWILSVLKISKCKIIFVESLCRVKSLSLTGKILMYIADEVLVQWPELATKYSKAKYIGRFL